MKRSAVAGKFGIGIAAALLMVAGWRWTALAAPVPAGSLETMTLEELMSIPVYAASRHEQAGADAPASVTIVTSEQIRRYGWRTMTDLLGSVRGFYVSKDRNYDYIGVRGFLLPGDYNLRILLLVDGHRENDMIYGQANVGRDFPVDVDLIDRVEIVRGPTSSVYGSNAFFAVVNVITRKGAALSGVELSAEAARYDTYAGRATVGSRLPGGTEYLLSGTGFKSVGPDLFFPEFADPAFGNGTASGIDGERQAGVFGSASFGDFDVRGVYSSRMKKVPTASYGTIFNDPRFRTWDDRAWVDLSWRKTFGRTEVTARAYYDWYRYKGDYPYAAEDNAGVPPLPYTVISKDGAKSQWCGAELLLSRRLGESHRITVGGEHRNAFEIRQWTYDESPYFRYLDDRRTERLYAAYVQDEVSLGGGFSVNAGVRYDHYTTFGGTTNPRLSLLWTPRPGTTLKLLFGSAFRAPTSYELFYNDGGVTQLSNPSLAPETIRTYEAVLEQAAGDKVRFTATVFNNRIRNLIDQESSDPSDPNSPLIFRNVGEVWATGGEAEIEGKWPGFEGRLSYTCQEVNNRETGKGLGNSPRQLVKVQVSSTFLGDRLVPALDVRYTGPRKTLMRNVTGGYAVANFTLSGRRLLPWLDLAVSMYNLFGKSYADPGGGEHTQDSIPQDGRSFRVKATATF